MLFVRARGRARPATRRSAERNQEDRECTLDSKCWFHMHNVELMCLVMAKCAGLLTRLLCWDNIGEASLPAINAVKAKKTKYFLLFLVVFWLCAAAAFWVQPLDLEDSVTRTCGELNHGPMVEDVCRSMAFLRKIFNVAIMGHFGLHGIEGTGQEIKANITEHLIDGKLEEENWTPYHMGAEVWQVLVAFTVNILALNVFISIVSNEYNKFAGAAVAHLMHFRTHFIFRDLLAKIVLEHVLKCFGFDLERAQPKEEENHLIYIKSSEYNKFQGQEEMTRQVLDEVKALRKENQTLREQLARVPKF